MHFDVLVIGGGHAGTEAAYAAAQIGKKSGSSTALVTLDAKKIGVMSCNPAIGGLAKGQLMKEIDAMGGLMGMNTDKTAIQYRILNERKGPAVRSSRCQCDKNLYAQKMQEFLSEKVENLKILEAEISEIVVDHNRVSHVKTKSGEKISARSVVITSGTFLSAVMHVGEDQTKGGRAGEEASYGLSANLKAMGFRLRRLKTGTPPRLDKATIDFSKTEPQPGDKDPRPVSFYYRNPAQKFPEQDQLNCFITHTNTQTHDIIMENLKRSPMYTGAIQGVGPRYCPSIEDKVKRFAHRDSHHLFLEPEGLDVPEIYVNGVSTSLPADVQEKFIHTVPGLEKAKFIRYGYAVEYDSIDARQLKATLESKDIEGLFFAGQVNGTSGYEEAGAQGLVAGINAAQLAAEKDPVTFGRGDGYLGVMIDDLILKGSDEPYRMFTSRAEYRLLLREDNADARLSPKARELGLLNDEQWEVFENRRGAVEKWRSELKRTFFLPGGPADAWLAEKSFPTLKDRVSAEGMLRRPEVRWADLEQMGIRKEDLPREVQDQIEIQVKYEGYIRRDLDLYEGVRKSEKMKIPPDLDLDQIKGLSNEVRSRLREVRPQSIGQMSRIQGVTPASVANMMIFLKYSGWRKGNSHERTSE